LYTPPRAVYLLFWSTDETSRKQVRDSLGENFMGWMFKSSPHIFANWVKPIRQVPIEELPTEYIKEVQ
jgi:hypothetical protein